MSTTTTRAADLAGLLAAVTHLDADVSDAERIDQLTVLERVKAVCAAAQARVTVDFAESQEQVAVAWRARAKECADGSDFEGWVAAREQARRATVASPDEAAADDQAADHQAAGRSRSRRPGAEFGVAGQVALARRESPARGSRHLALALALVRHLPRTLAALEAGELSEWRAEVVVRETAVLTTAQQTLLDGELFDTLGAAEVGMLGDRELARRVRAIAYRLDPQSVVDRARGAETDRRVTIRPAPDTMCYLTGYLPAVQGIAVHAALTAAAAAARAAGDQRGKGQVMADTLVERVTGQATADEVPVEVQVVITDRALLTNAFGLLSSDDRGGDRGGSGGGGGGAGRGGGDGAPASETPAQIPGYGTVPAAWARTLIRGDRTRRADETDDTVRARVWLRRLYTHPVDGTLVAMESSRRTFTGGLRRFLIARDGTCRTPWCDAPIAHLDHVTPHADGGPTTADNGQGLCARCNYTREHPGWRAHVDTAPPSQRWRRHTVVITTPTGHHHTSHAPPLLPGLPGLLSEADDDVGHDDVDVSKDVGDDGHGEGHGDSGSPLERHLETLLGAA